MLGFGSGLEQGAAGAAPYWTKNVPASTKRDCCTKLNPSDTWWHLCDDISKKG